MFKTAGKLVSLFILLILSFIYTDKVFSSVKENDPIMQEVTSYKKINDIKSVEPIVNEDELTLGYAGLLVNKKESYKKMKEKDKFDENNIVYDKSLPKNTISKTYEYYIKRGNPSKKNVALIFKVNDSTNINKMLNILSHNNIIVNFFVDGLWLEKNIETAFYITNLGSNIYNLGYEGNYSKSMINVTNNLIESITLKDSLYCLNESKNDEEKKICSKKKMHTITPTLIEPNFNELKQGLEKGAIISYDLKSFNMNEFILVINSITNKGYSITSLTKVLEE